MDSSLFLKKDQKLGRRDFLKLTSALGSAMLLSNPLSVFGQARKRISIATGGMGGVYFVIGGGIASILTKYAGVEAAAEVTAASVDNCKLVAAQKSDLALIMGDTGYDAYKGAGKFEGKPLPLRTLTVLYPNLTHIVTLEGKGIKKVADLKGKRVSTGAPGSGTEILAFRVLEAAGVNHEKDIKKDRLGVSESAGALKDGKIDAFCWSGGLPTAAILDLSASPGAKMAIIPHDDLIPKMTEKYGPIYYKSIMPRKIYTGMDQDVPVSTVANLMICHQEMDEKLGYDIVKTMFERLKDLAAIHKEALNINLKDGGSNTAVPYHKGAAKYFKEKGINVPV